MKSKKVIAGIVSMAMAMSMGLSSVSTFAASRTMNVNDWLEQCRSVANKVADERAKYSSKGCPTAYFDKNFSRAKYKSKTRLHCADYASWCLQRYGIIPAGQRFWVRGQQVKGVNNKGTKFITKNKKIQRINISKKGTLASTLVKRKGTKSLKKGDLVSVVKKNGKGNHIQIYAGKEEKTGKMLWYQVNSGSICDKKGYLKRSRMLRTVEGQHNGNPRIAMILRIKGLKYIDAFRVTTSHGSNGTITKSHNVKWGKDDVLKITPNTGYQISKLTVNGKAVKIAKDAKTYTLKNVRSTRKVYVSFEKQTASSKKVTTGTSAGNAAVKAEENVPIGANKICESPEL